MNQQRVMLRAVYWNMMHRCYNETNKMYHRYGGRGIKVCAAWRREGMPKFVEWAIANGWRPGLIFDREDNDGNYTPKNCRFVDRKTSRANRDLAAAFINASQGQKKRYRKQIERDKTSRSITLSWKRPSRKRKQSAALKKTWQRSDYLEAQSNAKKKQWADPEWRKRTTEAIRQAKKK